MKTLPGIKQGFSSPDHLHYQFPKTLVLLKLWLDVLLKSEQLLTFISGDNSLPSNDRVLGTSVQRLNCSLALNLAKTFLQAKAPNHCLDIDDISRAIENFSWIGRFEVIDHGDDRWILDGTHNTLSLEHAAAWFSRLSTTSGAKRQVPTRKSTLVN